MFFSVSMSPSFTLLFCLFLFQGKYVCSYAGCGAVLMSKSGYLRHMKRHQGIYEHHCPYCNKGLSGTTNAKEHIRAHHTGLRGYHCIRCKLELDSVPLLRAHLEQCKEGD